MMTEFRSRPKVLVFFADAVPTEAERELVYDFPQSVQVMTRNAAAVSSGDKPEQADYVAGAVPESYKDYPVFNSAAERQVRAEVKEARQRHEAELLKNAGLAADNGVKPQFPQTTGEKPQILAAADPDLAAIHGKDTRPPGEQPPKLGGVNLETAPAGFPGSVKPDGEGGATAGRAAGEGGAPADGTGAPEGGEGTTPAPGAPKPAPTPAWGKGADTKKTK